MKGNQIKVDHPREAIAHGIAYVPAERKSGSLILIQTVRENTTMASLDKITKNGIISRSEESRITKKWIEKFGIKTPTGETVIENLSGGNQQKVVMGRWMEINPRLLILNDPTRGVDRNHYDLFGHVGITVHVRPGGGYVGRKNLRGAVQAGSNTGKINGISSRREIGC